MGTESTLGAADASQEREAWLKLSEEALAKAWSNPAADVFNELFKK